MATKATRTSIISLRADESQSTLIDRAAEAVGKNRSDFILDAATREASSILLDRVFFRVNAQSFNRFVAALDCAPVENPRLRQLLLRTAPWERRAHQH
jgi:uncharacterized protein (DUF1778 family)